MMRAESMQSNGCPDEQVQVKHRPPSGKVKKKNHVLENLQSQGSSNRNSKLETDQRKCFVKVNNLIGQDLPVLKPEPTDNSQSSNKNKNQRPQSAKYVSHSKKDEDSDMFGCSDQANGAIKKRTRPHSAKCVSRVNFDTEDASYIVRPSVYGYTAQRQVFGSEPDLTNDGAIINDPVQLKETLESSTNGKPLPKCVENLRPWLTEDICADLIGISPENCLVFLPSLQNVTELPVVPPLQKPEDNLVYINKIEEPKPWKPKKYKHPFKVIPVEDWVCKHSKVKPVRIFDEDGALLHQTTRGPRTAAVVKMEIEELENLLRGIGTMDGSSSVAQYQAEINELQSMIDKTLPRVEEIERREREKNKKQEPADLCGLIAFCKSHDAVMEQIRQQHQSCLIELAELEASIGISEEDRHFTSQ